jgi:hypothetical protein
MTGFQPFQNVCTKSSDCSAAAAKYHGHFRQSGPSTMSGALLAAAERFVLDALSETVPTANLDVEKLIAEA